MVLTSQSFKERQLLTEFAQFRTTPLPGIYLSLHPQTPTIWYGVIFIRSNSSSSSGSSTTGYTTSLKRGKGEEVYSNIPIRFSITFGNRYPDVPPFVLIHGSGTTSSSTITSSTQNSSGGGGSGGQGYGYGDGGNDGIGTSTITTTSGGGGGGSGSGNEGVIIPHPLISRGSNSGRGLSAGYAGVHTGAVNLRDCYSGWFEPKNLPSSGINTVSKGHSVGGGGGIPAKVTTAGRVPGVASFPVGTSPVEVIFWLRGIFTEKYLRGLEERLDAGEVGGEYEGGMIVDEEAWGLWRRDREELRRRVGEMKRRGWDEGGVFGEWDGGGDVPIRFLDLQREALDTIKENLGRRLVGEA
ncbi:hypothetical protein AA313_de0206449 [Arthrobotrys entomopaga]|nr:hypothetical protein AA313_de0206449 [Arthrobotrys entomopaga]